MEGLDELDKTVDDVAACFDGARRWGMRFEIMRQLNESPSAYHRKRAEKLLDRLNNPETRSPAETGNDSVSQKLSFGQ